ncbi:MAG: protein translocase subunit SecD [bacterium]
MDKKAIWKWLLLVVLIAASLATVLPLGKKVRLGLDLQGGTSFTVEIDEEAIAAQLRDENKDITEDQISSRLPAKVNDAQGRALEVIRNRVDGLGISEPIIYPEKANRIVVQLPGVGEKKREEARETIKRAAFLTFRMVHEKNRELVDKLFEKGIPPPGFVVVSLSENNVSRNYFKRDRKTVPDGMMDQEFRKKLAAFNAPHGCEMLLEKEKVQGQEVYSPYFVEKRAQLTGDTLKNAAVDYRSLGQVVVSLEFNAKGARKFALVTSDYAPGGARNPNPQVGRQMAIVLDDTLYSAPVIREAIHGGRAEISGTFTVSEAALLSNVLKSGSLPAPVKIVEERTIDPSLGADTVRSGVTAGLMGIVAILVLMALYYLISGLLANVALVLNVVLLPLGMIVVAGVLGIFAKEARGGGAIALPVLTLPGIAGIALSIGMAVDANVLIFERMREELRAGKSLMTTIQVGFQRALSAILDSNLTTVITAVILFIMGSGPVRGYAVTLIAGLIVSVYTAVIVTRMGFNVIASRTSNTGVLKMMQAVKPTNFDFMKPWKTALGISLVVIVVSWGLMITHGFQDQTRVFGVDFTGGSQLTFSFDQKVGVEQLRAAMEAEGVKDATPLYQKEMQGGKEFLLVKAAGSEEGAKIKNVITGKFADSGFKLLQQDDVGPQIGAELKRKALIAMGLSLIAMIIYIWYRFELGFGMGAVAALFHDVLVTAGVCHLLGVQMNMTVMAALMTIVGYSVNDTIVIFDRIREDLHMVRGKSFLDICNQSMNETLSRTLLTNFLTFVSVLCLLVFGGGAIRDFSIAMFIGMISGTYSTVYIATPVVLLWYRFKTPDLGSNAGK